MLMPTEENNEAKPSVPPDPDLNTEDLPELEDFDEPFPQRRKLDPNSPAGRATSSLEAGLGSFFGRLNEVAAFINELAEKTEQAAQRAVERRQAANGEFRPQTNDRGLASRWGLGKTSILPERNTDNGSHLSPFAPRNPVPPVLRADAPPPPPPPNPSAPPDLTAAVREPLIEVHDEATEGIIIVIAELPGLEEAALNLEVLDDILIITGAGPDFRYEKELLLPAIVQTEPLSRSFQNSVLELRLGYK